MNPPDPTLLYQLATGYWSAATLLAANDLDLFSALAAGPATAPEIAARLRTDGRATEQLLNACVGLQLLTKTGARYQLSPLAAQFLLPAQPGYLGAALRWSADQYAAWGRLADAVRTGQPVVDPAQHLGADPAQTRAFVLGMHQRALGIARGLVPFLDLDGCRHLLDVGGGPGTYAVLLAEKHPHLRVTVLDLPAVVAIARELIRAPAVTTRAGDATAGDYGQAAYDAVLFCGVLHQMPPETIQRMLAGARRALQPGGRLIIADMMLEPDKTRPVFSALFSLQMLLTTRGGAVFAVEECARWLVAAGFTGVRTQTLPPPLPYSVITAQAP